MKLTDLGGWLTVYHVSQMQVLSSIRSQIRWVTVLLLNCMGRQATSRSQQVEIDIDFGSGGWYFEYKRYSYIFVSADTG